VDDGIYKRLMATCLDDVRGVGILIARVNYGYKPERRDRVDMNENVICVIMWVMWLRDMQKQKKTGKTLHLKTKKKR